MADDVVRKNQDGGIDIAVQRTLGPAALEDVLARLAGHPTSAGWTAPGLERWQGETVTFDLTHVELLDFASLGHLATIVEGLVRHGAAVEVRLPVPFVGGHELQRFDERAGTPADRREAAAALRARVQARSTALRFIRRSGFEDAVRVRHLPQADRLVRVVEGGGRPPLRLEDVLTDDLAHDEPHGERHGAPGGEPDPVAIDAGSSPLRLLPLRWLPRWIDDEQRLAWEQEAIQVLDPKSLVLTAGEAQAFAEVLVRQLVGNVHVHAAGTPSAGTPSIAPPGALVGAVLIEKPAARAFEAGARPAVRARLAELVTSQTPVLRLVVGDAGIGIAATQGERFPRGLLATRRGQPRGLQSVRRLVRENRGSLLLRSGEVLGGVVYGADGARDVVSETGLTWSPGTVVDVTLALPAAARLPAVPAVSHVAAGAAVPPAGLVALRVTSGDGPAVDMEIDMEVAARDLRDRLRSASGGFLVASLPVAEMSDRAAERLFDQVLELAGQLPGGFCLVLLAPASSASRLFPQARAYDDARGRDARRCSTPVMLRDERGRTAWLGAGRTRGRLLAHLTPQAGRRSAVVTVAGALGLPTATVHAAIGELADWVEQAAGDAWLRVTPAMVDAALPDLLRRRLDAALELPAVAQHGGFVTPTLERVSMWLDGTRLIAEMGGSHLVGYTLATLVRARHPRLDLERAVLVRLGSHLPDAFARAFGDTLGLQRKVYRLSGEVGLHDDAESLLVGQSTPVVVLTDVIVSGNTARGAAIDLLRQGANPRLVVALVDYGRLAANDLHREPAPHIVALAQVDNPVPPAERLLETIEPLRSQRGQGYTRPAGAFRLAPEELLQWCAECRESVLTGHIARFARRHFSTFLNAAALLRAGSTTATAIAAMVTAEAQVYVEGLRKLGHAVPALEVWFPGDPAEPAGVLARLVADRLRADDPTPLRCRGVERVMHRGRKVFPAPRRPLAAGTHVLVVDWGAVTSRTLLDLLGRAADGNAASAHAVVFSSQLDPEDETAVRRIRRIRRISRRGGEELPARISFVSSFATGYEPAAECRLCALVREYSADARSAPAAALRIHARQLAAVLEPSDLTDAQARGPRDLFGEDLTPREAVDIVRWQHDLDATLTSTGQRSRLLARLRALPVDDPSELVALVRLLLLEPRWLKLPPLRLTDVRMVLAELVSGLITGDRLGNLPVSVQRQLVIVLRMAAKRAFLRVVADMVDPARRVALPSVVVTDALFGVYTIVKRQYHHDRPYMAAARQALLDGIQRIDGSDVSRGDERSLGTLTVLNGLLALCDYHEHPFDAGPRDARQAWATLRYRYYQAAVGHFDVALRMSNIMTALQVPSVRGSDRWLSTLADWHHLQRFLTERVLPYLPAVEPIVTPYVDEFGSARDIEGWNRTLTSDIVRELNEVGEQLNRFVADPQRALLERAAVRRKVDWWYEFFFLRTARRGEFPPPSLLGLLHECPSDVTTCVTQGVHDGVETARRMGAPFDAVRIVPPDRPLRAFVTRSVLANAAHQLVENAAKHRDPSGTGSEIEVEITGLGPEVVVAVRNTGSRPAAASGAGHYRHQQYLGAFDAALEAVPPVAPWTYEARLTLQRWTAVDPDEKRGAP